MATNTKSKLLSFEISDPASYSDFEQRRGRLQFRNRTPIETPHFIAVTSRGAVPHLSQDTMRDQTSITGIYAAVEDCE